MMGEFSPAQRTDYRKTALDHASKLLEYADDEKRTAENLIAEAKKIEAYLLGDAEKESGE